MIYHLKRNKEGMKMLNFEIRYTKALVILCILAVIFIGLSLFYL